MESTLPPVSQSQSQPLIAPLGDGQSSDDIQDKFFDYPTARIHLERIVKDWSTEIEETEQRRLERKVDINVESLRQEGSIDEDETIIPIRVIDSNIQRELPPFINYLKNSRRIAIFECLDNPILDCDQIEQEFTKKSTYTKWEVPHYRTLDGAATHGWDAVEVVYDETKPGHYGIEQIGHDKLLFPRSAIDLQQCPRLIRVYDVTILQLQKWVKNYGFDKNQVDLVVKSRKDTQKENETIQVYKVFLKKDSVVYVGWFTLKDFGVNDWLKAPQKHYIGVDEQKQPDLMETATAIINQQPPPQPTWQPKDLTLYPIFLLPYRETEEQKIANHKGRCFLDGYKQEAQTALWSSFVNGMTRASNIYGSLSQEDGTGSSLKEVENLPLRGGRLLNKPITFWQLPYPDPVVLRTLQYADVANSEETNQVNFAAMNREDSRKTAKEIGAAQQQQTLLNSVQLTLFSTFIREVYGFAWLIVQSQALQNKIKFLLKEVPSQQPQMPGMPPAAPIYQNDVATIGMMYSIRAAGDVDVIQKEELIQKMQQDFALVMNTPLASTFTIDYFKLKYPDSADRYATILGQADQMNQMKSMIGRLGTMLDGVLKDAPQALQQLPPNERAELAQTIQQAQQMSGQQGSQQPTQ